jgi:hypothetical protein
MPIESEGAGGMRGVLTVADSRWGDEGTSGDGRLHRNAGEGGALPIVRICELVMRRNVRKL